MQSRTRPLPVLVLIAASLAGCDYLEAQPRQPSDASPAAAASGHAPPSGTAAEPATARGGDTAPVATSVATPASPTTPADDALVPFTGKVADGPTPATCALPGFTAPARYKLFAAGAYAGRKLDYQIDQSGHQATRIDVAVNHAGEPVVLMLGAYEPTVWNIGWTRETRIAGVLVSGYHRQAVAGLPADVPVLLSSYDNRGACGYFYVSQDRLEKLNPLAQRMFGRNVDMVYLAGNGSVTIGAATTPGALVTSPRVSPDAFRDPDAPLAGPAGLRDAVAKGLLREAAQADLAAWEQAFEARQRERGEVPPVAGQARASSRTSRGYLHNGYVVLKPMAVPAGLYGAHSASFIVPKGVPRPTGNLGHSTIYDFNTLTCAGTGCNRD